MTAIPMWDPAGDGGTPKARGDRRIFVVVNPQAAGGQVGRSWPEIYGEIASVLGPFEFRFTDAAGAATLLTREALFAGADVVASLGGDGTHNETIHGFFGPDGEPINPQAAIAVLPFGTGGDFRKSLGLSRDLGEAARRLLEAEPRPLDVGRVTLTGHDGKPVTRHFINIASFGIAGLVDKKVNESSKALGGTASFVLGTVRALTEFVPQAVRLVVDDHIDVHLTIHNVAVANGRFFGGGMKVAPFAEIDDGLFDVVIIRDLDLGGILTAAVRLYDGHHFRDADVTHLQARRVRAEPVNGGDVVLLDLDGEQPGQLPATFEILPGVVRIVG